MVHIIVSQGFEQVCQCFLQRQSKNFVRALFHNGTVVNRINFQRRYLFKKVPVTSNVLNNQENLLKCSGDSDIIYSTFIEENKNYILKKDVEKVIEEFNTVDDSSLPLSLQRIINKKVSTTNSVDCNEKKYVEDISVNNIVNSNSFPFSKFQDIDITNFRENINSESDNKFIDSSELTVSIKDDISYRLKTYEERKKKQHEVNIVSDTCSVYEDSFTESIADNDNSSCLKRPIYGTPNPSVESSSIPCGGCGAFLHCQKDSLPGYLPSELFIGKSKRHLRSSLCQRCFFLETYNVALNVRVTPAIYEQSLQPIVSDKALVVVVVDILDAPCSIWPGLFKFLGPHRPVFVVGNKVDLLPPDSRNHLVNIKKSFLNVVNSNALSQRNIKHVALVSAKTGYGIEDLISRLQLEWGTKGNIYIIGCTNSGKSTLFNALLGSDMCQNQASDLIRRATTSPWPGTTLNLLKFPLMKPTGERITRRMRRLKEEKLKESHYLLPKKRFTFDYTEATLTGHIGRTFLHDVVPNERVDPFRLNVKNSEYATLGLNDQLYRECKWLFDTPGTIQPDQLLGLLTHKELLQVLPQNMISPRTFSLRLGQSLFLGGLARLDVLYISSLSVRLTVFSSSMLPVTIVNTVNASSFYRKNLGTKLLNVPEGGEERLARWPCLKPVNVSLNSRFLDGESCADIVLSSAGFISITGEDEMELRGWTPSGRGVYIREPPLLPLAVRLKGRRIKGTPAFHKHKIYVSPNDE